MTAHLELVDWRARVSDLYAEVRRQADPEAGHRVWVEGRRALFATHPQSPTADHPDLEVSYWPYNPSLRWDLPLLPAEAEQREVPAGDDGSVTMERVGQVELPIGGSLDVWWLAQYGGGLFVPIKDGTSGTSTYGGGRYLLDTAKGAWLGGEESELVIDLNFAYHPSCRYDSRWQCPLAPVGNAVAPDVEVGERL